MQRLTFERLVILVIVLLLLVVGFVIGTRAQAPPLLPAFTQHTQLLTLPPDPCINDGITAVEWRGEMHVIYRCIDRPEKLVLRFYTPIVVEDPDHLRTLQPAPRPEIGVESEQRRRR